ncbi:carboxypeptidase-like regulatory domain-containing protein [Zobellia galactanivorans]|uniref:carboxypeptidase-like regulatory domain-containing protein n=1 Tax=Zobellia galactanivorans (strain DSM 12802 / CCUG 47099 / CIP 106680 / NCIMB 13871 / Dsij) TaxID=63186 RepID=UPI0026E3A1E0|nr:carboxypeptidase-like regulatory domain-containing protein [Zobellia galactanivorans]MDO6809535.1 carboxypeptidase-like regulatory domain-containing protein [Zobellia galactanivorans]
MKRNSFLFAIFFTVLARLAAQDLISVELEGRVYSKDGDVAATHVLNTTTKKATITDIDGFFDIAVKLNDTLVFSAVQYKRKEIVVSMSILESKFLMIPLEEALTELDEVIVTPYSLSGHMASDLQTLEIEPVVTASTLGLPNAFVVPMDKAERELRAATANPFMSLDPLINTITGRKKMLKARVKRNEKYERTQRVREFYVDSLYTVELKIAQDKIDDFLYFCEVDSAFQQIVDTHDRLRIWDFMKRKSVIYRRNHREEE